MEPDRLKRIFELIEASLDDPSLDGVELARRAHLSRFHFDRLVQAAVGEAPGAFRRRLAMERAAYRLSRTADPVIDVAFDAGYRAPEAFARAFTRAYGRSPSAFRRDGDVPRQLPSVNGIHFHPPAGIRIPAAERSTSMDVAIAMLDHHLSLVAEILARADRIPAAALERPIELSVEGIDADPTLRSLCERLVGQLEMWNAALAGQERIVTGEATSPAALGERLEQAAPRFRETIVTALRDGRAGETFVDATCEPPQTFSYGGVLAHVLTFSAVRRTLAIGALEDAGVGDLGSGDPMGFVGGAGDDAATIRRRWA